MVVGSCKRSWQIGQLKSSSDGTTDNLLLFSSDKIIGDKEEVMEGARKN